MCGTGISEIDNLLECIKHRKNCTTDKYSVKNHVFLYVKSWCGNSKKAVQKLLQDGLTQITLFDVENNTYLCPEKWTATDSKMHVKKLQQAWFHETVPQVFVHESDWKFLPGGNSAVQSVSTVARTSRTVPKTGLSRVLKF